MAKRAWIVTVTVRVQLAAKPNVDGFARTKLLTNENYSEVNLGQVAIKGFDAAKAEMRVKQADWEHLKRLQTEMFAEI